MDNNHEYKLKQRNLGDEWDNWSGIIEENAGDLDTSPHLFLILMALAEMLIIGGVWFLYFFLINIDSLQYFHNITTWGVISYTLVHFFYVFTFSFTLLIKKPLAFYLKEKPFVHLSITKLALAIGEKLRIPRDKVINSSIKVNNEIAKIIYPPIEKEELLILVPRCLSKDTRTKLNTLVKGNQLSFHIAAGGNEARKILKEKKPKGIIAVACERDLYAGIKDVPVPLPIIAIANKRPEGPCRNTNINMNEIEEAITFFLDNKEK